MIYWNAKFLNLYSFHCNTLPHIYSLSHWYQCHTQNKHIFYLHQSRSEHYKLSYSQITQRTVPITVKTTNIIITDFGRSYSYPFLILRSNIFDLAVLVYFLFVLVFVFKRILALVCPEGTSVVHLPPGKIHGMQFKESAPIRLRTFSRFKEAFSTFEHGLWISEDSSSKGLVSVVK